jgi:hypothetical protein
LVSSEREVAMERWSIIYVSKGRGPAAWEAACARAHEAVAIRAAEPAPPEREGLVRFAGFDLPADLDSLLCVLAASPAS